MDLLMVLLAVIPALFFEWRTFCKYGCLIGRICGLYSMVAPVEVRPKDGGVCAGHFLTEAEVIVSVLSDPAGLGRDIFGTVDFTRAPLVSQGLIWALMIGLVLIGHLWAVRALERAHRRLADGQNGGMPWGGRVVLAAFLFAATASNLWLLAQPMEMRTRM